MTPTVGRIVHYKLSDYDAAAINQRRGDAAAFRHSVTEPVEAGETGRTGHVEHTGNQAGEGDVCAAVIVRVFSPATANLQVLLDGNDHYWATSRMEGDGPGQWSWPPRA